MTDADRVEFLPVGFRLPRPDEQAHYLRITAAGGDASLLKLLGPDDTFTFGCKRCGHCCEARVPSAELLLPSEVKPLRLLARAKGLPPPMALPTRDGIRHTPPAKLGRSCDWLVYPLGRSGPSLCAVQESKPALCRLSPLGVMVDHPRRVVILVMAKDRRRRLQCSGMQGGRRYSIARWAEETDLAGFVAMAQWDWEAYQASLVPPEPFADGSLLQGGDQRPPDRAVNMPSFTVKTIPWPLRLWRAFLNLFRGRKES